ncbi:MAG: Rho termination factor N-terminal domain-containing protein [Candidatus Thorarchaeota archaeon]|jgi:hypothetical protein
MPLYTRQELENMNAKEMKKMAFRELGISGVSKSPKAEVIEAILSEQDSGASATVTTGKPMSGLQAQLTSVMNKPEANFGNRTATTIEVSCGANTGNFPVVGRTVGEVAEYLREVLNVTRMSTGLVDGKEVGNDYVLKEEDRLEFLKPTGKKG